MNFWDDVAPIIVLSWLGFVVFTVTLFVFALAASVITEHIHERRQIHRLEALLKLPAREVHR